MKKGRIFTVKVRPFFLLTGAYGCCPGGALPAGFVAGFCVSPPPLHTGCWPPGWLPPWLVQFAGVILANATPPNDIVSANISAANNNEMRLRIGSLSSLIVCHPIAPPG